MCPAPPVIRAWRPERSSLEWIVMPVGSR
jgi:hypothetical protein